MNNSRKLISYYLVSVFSMGFFITGPLQAGKRSNEDGSSEDREVRGRIDESAGAANKPKRGMGMITACKAGNLERIKELFKEKSRGMLTDVNVDGLAPIHIAAQHGRHDILRWLVEQGVNINSGKFRLFKTALDFAPDVETMEVIRSLGGLSFAELESRARSTRSETPVLEEAPTQDDVMERVIRAADEGTLSLDAHLTEVQHIWKLRLKAAAQESAAAGAAIVLPSITFQEPALPSSDGEGGAGAPVPTRTQRRMSADKKSNDIIDACIAGDLERLKHLVTVEKLGYLLGEEFCLGKISVAGNEINERGECKPKLLSVKSKPIHLAAMFGQHAIIQYLLTQGQGINSIMSGDKHDPFLTPLDLASDHATQELIMSLGGRYSSSLL